MRSALALAGCALALAGCALALGACGRSTTPAAKRDALAQASATHEYPSPAPAAQSATGGSDTPAQAVESFTRAYINWTADTVTQDMRELAARSVGQARSAMALAAAQTAGDYELRQGGIANRGAVEALAPLSGARDRYVVVTRELTVATNTAAYQGLRPAWHVALATVAQLSPGRWVLSGWQPES